MELDKAIEILQDLLGVGPQYPPDDRRKAVMLGMQAIKRVMAGRPKPPSLAFLPLPGETE